MILNLCLSAVHYIALLEYRICTFLFIYCQNGIIYSDALFELQDVSHLEPTQQI